MRKRSRRRKGFTLLEVLLVLVILVILSGMATVFLRGAGKQARYNATKAQISAFEEAIDLYQINNINYPNALPDLLAPPGGEDPYLNKAIPADPWGNPYQYVLESPESYLISSWGPDGVSGTEDDIYNK